MPQKSRLRTELYGYFMYSSSFQGQEEVIEKEIHLNKFTTT